MKQTFVADADELRSVIANARWFAHYFVRSKKLENGLFRVTTNYPWR